jgi:hypothetical protein
VSRIGTDRALRPGYPLITGIPNPQRVRLDSLCRQYCVDAIYFVHIHKIIVVYRTLVW